MALFCYIGQALITSTLKLNIRSVFKLYANSDHSIVTIFKYLQYLTYFNYMHLFEMSLGDKFSLYPSLVPMSLETHGGEDVAVWARGPWAHLFVGSFEQNVLPLIMSYASCIGPSREKCSNR